MLDVNATVTTTHPVVFPDECPFCETPNRYGPPDANGTRFGTTFFWRYWWAPSLHPSGRAWEVVRCSRCGGELYNGPAR